MILGIVYCFILLALSKAVPKFISIYKAFGTVSDLPAITKIIISIPPYIWIVLSFLFLILVIAKDKFLSKKTIIVINLVLFLGIGLILFIAMVCLYLPVFQDSQIKRFPS